MLRLSDCDFLALSKILYHPNNEAQGISWKRRIKDGLYFILARSLTLLQCTFEKVSEKKRITKVSHLWVVAEPPCTEANLSSVWSRLLPLKRTWNVLPNTCTVITIIWEFEKLKYDIVMNQVRNIQFPWCPGKPYHKINKRRKFEQLSCVLAQWISVIVYTNLRHKYSQIF